MRTIDVDGVVSVDDLLRALGLEAIPAGCALGLDDEIKIAVTADAEAVRDEIEDMFDDGHEGVNLKYLREAITALRDGESRTAMILFGSVFDEFLAPEMGVIEGALLSRKAA